MAVAWDAGSESHTGSTGNVSAASFTWNHTPVGTPRGVLVFVMEYNEASVAGDALRATGVTYGGTALTKVGEAFDTATERGYISAWFLGSSIATGVQAVVVNRTNDAVELYAGCNTFTASADCEIFGVQQQSGDIALAEVNVTDGSPGTNSVRMGGVFSGQAAVNAVGGNTTARQGIDFGNAVAQTCQETTAGQGSRPVGWSATIDDVAAVYLAVREISSQTVTPTTLALVLAPFAATIAHQITGASPTALTLSTFAPVLKLQTTPTTLALTLSTFAPTVSTTAHQTVTPTTAALTLTTLAPVMKLGLTATTAALTLTSFAPVLKLATIPTTTALVLAPFAATVTASNHQSVTPTTVSLSLTSFAPTVSTPRLVTVTTLALSLTTFAPTVTAFAGLTATPTTAVLSLTTFAPTVTATAHQTLTPTTAALTLSVFAPTVSTPRLATPTTASFSLSTLAPSVSVSLVFTPTTKALILSVFAPSVTATANQNLTALTAALSLTGFSPSVTATAHQTVIVATAALLLTGLAPEVSAAHPVHATITGTLVMAPRVSGTLVPDAMIIGTLDTDGGVSGTIQQL